MEEHFQDIVTAAEQEALQNIVEDIDIVDNSDGLEVVQTGTQVSITSAESDTSSDNVNSLEAPTNTPELTSLSTLSIEVISPQEVQQESSQQPESDEATLTITQVPFGPALHLPLL